MLDRYLRSRYEDSGRGPDAFDCWGLTRLARHEIFGKPLLPSYGAISASDKRRLTSACASEAKAFRPCRPTPGAIATAWRGKLCIHVALVVDVDGRSMILETNQIPGPQLTDIRRFESRFLKVIYYDD